MEKKKTDRLTTADSDNYRTRKKSKKKGGGVGSKKQNGKWVSLRMTLNEGTCS